MQVLIGQFSVYGQPAPYSYLTLTISNVGTSALWIKYH